MEDYARSRKRACERLFLATEAVDEAHVEADIVLEGAAEGGAEVAGRDAEGEVGVDVDV